MSFPRLPHWVVPNKFPAFYDSESATAIEMTAKLYKHVENLIDDYNKFVDNTNKAIDDFENGVTTDMEVFKVALRQEFQDFIDVIDLKMVDAENYMKNNLKQVAEAYLKTITDALEKSIADFNKDKEYFREEFAKQNQNIEAQNITLSNALRVLDSKIVEQDSKIESAVQYMQDNITANVNQAVSDMITNGDITFGLIYNEETEDMTWVARNVKLDTDLAIEYDEETESILLNEVPKGTLPQP